MIEWLFQHLDPLIRNVIHKPYRIIFVSFVLAILGFYFTMQLNIDNDLSKLIPNSYPSVQALNKLTEQVGGEHEATVAIESPSFEANKKFAEALIAPVLKLKGEAYDEPYFRRVEFQKDVSFLKNNALYFATDSELDLLEEYLRTEIEDAKNKANPFYFDLDEEPAVNTDSLADELNLKYDELVGSEYTMSADSTILVIKFYPTGSQTDLEFIEDAYADLNALIQDLNPQSFHPDMKVAAAGRMLRTLIEIETIVDDIANSFGAGVLMLMLAVLIYFFYKGYTAKAGMRLDKSIFISQIFQIPSHFLITAMPLVVSLSWTFGLAYLIYGHLNIMTSTLGLLLFGMGIDFGIHFFARYTEERSKGETVPEAIETTFMTTGQAIFAVGITTAAAFFILMIADFKGFSEFGAISGLGLIFAILAYVVFLPALLVMLERSPLMSLHTEKPKSVAQRQPLAKEHGHHKSITAYLIIVVSVLITGVAIMKIPSLEFEYDFGSLEPRYERYHALNDIASRAYSDKSTRNSAYVVAENAEDAKLVAQVLRERMERDSLTPTIREVEIFQDRYPFSTGETRNKLERLESIRSLLNDPFIKNNKDQNIERLRLAASTDSAITLQMVPEFLKAPFTSTSGIIGNLVIIHPSKKLSDGRNSMNFADDTAEITLPNGKIYYAGSTSIVASDMLRLLMSEAPTMVLLTIAFIVLFKLFILKKAKWILLALLPLILSFIWLFGFMEIIGWKLNFYNLVVLPTILGIGDDSGIHIIHRYLEEGKGSIKRVLHSTGEHITVSTLTTMLGFGGLLFSIHPGLRTIGEVAVLGIGLSLLTALLLLPALLKVMEAINKDV